MNFRHENLFQKNNIKEPLKNNSMKKSIILIFLFIFNFSFSQKGKIQLKNDNFKSGKENNYLYESPSGVTIPDNSLVAVVYLEKTKKNAIKNNYVPLLKKGTNFEFALQVPDSTSFLFLAIVDSKNKIVDNNTEKGYVVYLNAKTKQDLEKAKLLQLNLTWAADNFLKTKITSEEILAQYEELFKQNPSLTETKYYLSYLNMKLAKNKEETTPKLIQLAQKLEKKNTEKDLISAYSIYSNLGNKEKGTELKKQIIATFPKGEMAKNDFIMSFYSIKDKSEVSILAYKQKFAETFNDQSSENDDFFYSQILSICLKNRDSNGMEKYEKLISDKSNIARQYNDVAWDLVGEDTYGPAKEIDFAEKISKKSLDFVKETMNISKENQFRLQDSYYNYIDTYATILFKQKKYDLAFQYLDEMSKEVEFNAGSKAKYAAFAENVKGLHFTKDYIEKELKAGTESIVMLNQLQNIYKGLNLPETEFEKIKATSIKETAQKAKEELIKQFGTDKAIDFALTNLEGKNVKLSDYLGKVVVLDFWATWCGPCRASFPAMQEMVTKYKNDNVVFLFMDVWENGEPKETLSNVSKFITDNKYTFNVLFDYTKEIATKYKIEGIPSKVVIDKKGNFVNPNFHISTDNLDALIAENLKK
jgi:thiol-disulfide isomerase/thioredoxin